ncbi:spore germination protein KB [Clostridium acidisoli DSM 12555]|uniref:Spore germination protein KB n=1 Tax=Clostridium acidisoli DSM 12555 TaxID=1121291 RepID=A0A1W1XSD9_9CLOT|nr:endospore germination permease [Clostridium acidisoli]SMC26438.1 spore germination protein KB [Clostridium acidisoli DSM 12555]
MKIEKGIISNEQLLFLVIGLLQASTLTASFISGITKQNTWIVLLAGFIIILPVLLVYTSLNKKFPHKNLIEINNAIYGEKFGKVISLLYIFFFWFIICTNVRFIVDFFSTYLFPKTDISVFTIIIIITCNYTVKKGLEVIARTGFILSVLTILAFVLITIFTIKDINLSNFLPIFQINLKEFIMATNIIVAIPLGEIIVFLMIFPYVNDVKNVKKSVFLGLIIGSLFFFSVIVRNISVIGNIGYMDVQPEYQVAKLVNIGEIITRVEVLVAIILLFNVFLKICIFYYATVLSIAQCLKLRSYKPLTIPVGIISIILSISMFNSPVDESYLASIYSVFVIPFIMLFPVISLIIASIRKFT